MNPYTASIRGVAMTSVVRRALTSAARVANVLKYLPNQTNYLIFEVGEGDDFTPRYKVKGSFKLMFADHGIANVCQNTEHSMRISMMMVVTAKCCQGNIFYIYYIIYSNSSPSS